MYSGLLRKLRVVTGLFSCMCRDLCDLRTELQKANAGSVTKSKTEMTRLDGRSSVGLRSQCKSKSCIAPRRRLLKH